MNFWMPVLLWKCHLFYSGGYIRAEFPVPNLLVTDSHCDQHEVSFNKGLIFTVRLSCDLPALFHACIFNVWIRSKRGLVGLS